MVLACREQVLAYTKELVQQGSVVNTPGEKQIAQVIYNRIRSFPYFKEHPSRCILSKTVSDSKDRANVLAFVKGAKTASNRTILLMGHMDTVGIEDFGNLQHLALDPDAILTVLQTEDVPNVIQESLQTGNWMFGRGVLDMKSGVASHLYLLQYYSEHPEELDGNLVFLAECDEEDGSHGILSALKDLKLWKEHFGFDYVAAVNADFVSPRYPGDPNRYIYKGTVGKLLPSFFIRGAETHVGSCFEGLDPNFLAAELTRQIDYNPELCDEAYGEFTVPPVSLKQTDLKPFYDVQTALSAYVYYNFFVHSWSPKEVLEKLQHHAKIAFSRGLQLYNERYQTYCKNSGESFHQHAWEARVLTYEELQGLLIRLHGQTYVSHMEQVQDRLVGEQNLDTRMFAARVVEEACKWLPDNNPIIVLFFSSLHSPRIELSGKNENERKLIEALEQAVQEVQPSYPQPIVVRNFFPYISDMSFVALSDDEEGIRAESINNPNWGKKIHVEYQDIRELDIPVINVGPYGIDAHKKYERMEMTFSLEVVPTITKRIIDLVIGAKETFS